MNDNAKLIKDTKRYFIHEKGYVFKTEGSREIVIPINIIQGIPRVNIGNKKVNLVLLMLEYFYEGELNQNMSYTFKIVNNRIPIKNINVKLFKGTDEDELIIFQYKCNVKASSQNCRVNHENRIDAYDVLNCLKRTDFKCQYCGSKLKPTKWHLDHVQPISKSGINDASNITPSCKECNLMKGALGLDKFLHQVSLIHNNYNLKKNNS